VVQFKFDFSCSSTPDLARGAYSTLTDLLAGCLGLLLREGGKEGMQGEERTGRRRNKGKPFW